MEVTSRFDPLFLMLVRTTMSKVTSTLVILGLPIILLLFKALLRPIALNLFFTISFKTYSSATTEETLYSHLLFFLFNETKNIYEMRIIPKKDTDFFIVFHNIFIPFGQLEN
jgi:hypothetical protein